MSALTFETVQKAVEALRQAPQPSEFQLTVHPLRYLLIKRRCDPTYCRYLGLRLASNWRQLYDQTFADHYGWGINGYE